MLFHKLGEDGILALDLGFELFDLAVLGVLFDLGLAAVLEGGMAVLEELLEPGVDLGRMKIEFVAQVGDWDLLEKMTLEDGYLLLRGKMSSHTFVGHSKTSV